VEHSFWANVLVTQEFVVERPVGDITMLSSISVIIEWRFSASYFTLFRLIGWVLKMNSTWHRSTPVWTVGAPVPAVGNNPLVRSYVTVAVGRVRQTKIKVSEVTLSMCTPWRSVAGKCSYTSLRSLRLCYTGPSGRFTPGAHWTGGLSGPRSRSGRFGDEINLLKPSGNFTYHRV
jgi:hypothetical protein